ncbi:tyrosine-type recombinase/integrase [Amycolatopsis sp. NBC_00345]|uniref:tyrosine-type recombinase/integrase n=1 Tax=Amycolatopsis sp. NBC_00345 TaxID=2975955 RepID=UPI002E2557B9
MTPSHLPSVDLKPGQHQLRHFYASAEIADGVAATEVQKRLGHKNLRTTVETYHHLFEDQEDRAAERVNARMVGLPIVPGGDSDATGTDG